RRPAPGSAAELAERRCPRGRPRRGAGRQPLGLLRRGGPRPASVPGPGPRRAPKPDRARLADRRWPQPGLRPALRRRLPVERGGRAPVLRPGPGPQLGRQRLRRRPRRRGPAAGPAPRQRRPRRRPRSPRGGRRLPRGGAVLLRDRGRRAGHGRERPGRPPGVVGRGAAGRRAHRRPPRPPGAGPPHGPGPRSWNPGIETITGYPASEMLGTRNLALMRPRDDEGRDVLVEQWASRPDVHVGEIQVLTRAGELRWLSCSSSVADSAEGRPGSLVV